MIEVFDNVLDYETVMELREIILKENETSGLSESDRPGEVPAVSTTINFDEGEGAQKPCEIELCLDKCHELIPRLQKMNNYRNSINVYPPKALPYWHEDTVPSNPSITTLLYINPNVELDELGETQFYIKDEIRCIQSKPGRLIAFDGRILHRAMGFRTLDRLTIAMKFE